MEAQRQDQKDPNEGNPLVRFSDIIPREAMEDLSVTIVGAGGIGAPAALCLAKMGVRRLKIYDHDTVEEPNLGTQMYSRKQLGKPKVLALKRYLKQQADWCEVEVVHDWFTNQEVDTPVIVSAVDSLEVRRQIWTHVYNNTDVSFLVDPRMGAEVLNVIHIVPKVEKAYYEKTLEGEAISAPCTAKATFYTGLVAGALTAQAVKAWAVNERKDVFVDYSIDLRYINMMGTTLEQIEL